jgi:glutamate transport system permease protein
MSASVLYDHPGPRARRREILVSIAFLAVLAFGVWWVVGRLAAKHEFDAVKWRPFTTSNVWSNFLIPGIEGTLKAAALSMAIALPAGILLAFARLSERRWISWPATAIVEFFRAIPVLLLMFFAQAYYFTYGRLGADSVPLYSVVTGLVLYNGSVLCEIFRAGILALPKGQTEAAAALGLRRTQTMVSILLPQALTAMLPAVVSQLVVTLKDTALGGQLVGYVDLMRQASTLSANFSNTVATYIVIGTIYVVINFVISVLAGQLETRLRTRRGRRAERVIAVPLPGGLAGGAPPGGAMGPPAAPEHAVRR